MNDRRGDMFRMDDLTCHSFSNSCDSSPAFPDLIRSPNSIFHFIFFLSFSSFSLGGEGREL